MKPQTTQQNAQTTTKKSFVTTIKPTIVITTSPTTNKKPSTTKKQTTKPTTSTTIKQTTPTTVKWTTRRSTKRTNTTSAKEAISTGEKQTTQTATTTFYLTPKECQEAVNYTESWRRDYDGSNIKPRGPFSWAGYTCDLHVNKSQWFRFAGAAGNRMLDYCVKEYSCGTRAPLWTDNKTLPTAVGVEATVKAYESYNNKCKYLPRNIKVMRCSWDTPYDFIYKQTNNSPYSCRQGFCGRV